MRNLELIPITIREANLFVDSFHRHNRRTHGGRFAIGVEGSDSAGSRSMVGVAIVGNPISATFMDGFTAEVLRVCTCPDAPKNTCSILYGACWRAWRAMGGRRMVTYTLQTESGASLRGAGWRIVAQTEPQPIGWRKRDGKVRPWQPIYGQQKFRWEAPSGFGPASPAESSDNSQASNEVEKPELPRGKE